MAPRWEYKTETVPSEWGGSLNPAGYIENHLNREGVNGWELVTATQINPGYVAGTVGLIWKRSLKEVQ